MTSTFPIALKLGQRRCLVVGDGSEAAARAQALTDAGAEVLMVKTSDYAAADLDGVWLAVLTARTTFYKPDDPDFALGGGWYGVFMPVIVLAIPLYDFITVTTIRVMQGKSPFVGDQQHFSHRLVQRGLSKRGAVLVIWGATAVTGIGGIALGSLQAWQAILVGVQTLLMLMIIWALEHASRRAVDRRGGRS